MVVVETQVHVLISKSGENLEAGLRRRRHRDRSRYHYRTATVPFQPRGWPAVLGAAPERTRENLDTLSLPLAPPPPPPGAKK